MVHPDRRKLRPVVESPTRAAERNIWQPPRVVPEQSRNEADPSVADLGRVPLPATSDRVRHAGFLQ